MDTIGEPQWAVTFAFAAMAECHRMGRCDAATIDRMVANPAQYFRLRVADDRYTDEKSLRTQLAAWPEVHAFIAAGARILSPPPGTTEVEALRAAAGLVFEVFEVYLRAIAMKQLGKNDEALQLIRAARDLLSAAVDQNLARVVTASRRLLDLQYGSSIGEKSYELEKLTQIAGAIGSYLTTYAGREKPTNEELAARREARKAAINSLIDAQAERRNRLDEWILSIGASPSVFVGAGAPTGEDSSSGGASVHAGIRVLPLSIPLGFAMDYHSRNSVGFHAELAPINLGAYLALQSPQGVVAPSPADAISPSITLGTSYLFRDADLITFGGGTIGYAFKYGNDNADPYRAFYIGVSLGAYVPIFDVN